MITLTLDLQAQDRIKRYQAKIEPRLGPGRDLSDLEGWGAKLVGHTARLAAIVHLASGASILAPVSVDSVDRAIAIADYLIDEAKATLDLMGADEELAGARHLLKWIQARDVRTFTRSEAQQKNRSTFERAEDIDGPLRILEDHAWIRPLDDAEDGQIKPGRPKSPRYQVNPRAHEDTETS